MTVDEELVFAPPDASRRLHATFAVVSAVLLVFNREYFAELDGTVVAVFLAVLGSMWAGGVLLAKRAARCRLIIGRDSLTVRTASDGRTVPFAAVTGLAVREMQLGQVRRKTYFAALADGEEVRLFHEGVYREERRILSELAARTGKTWS